MCMVLYLILIFFLDYFSEKHRFRNRPNLDLVAALVEVIESEADDDFDPSNGAEEKACYTEQKLLKSSVAFSTSYGSSLEVIS